MVKKKKCSKLLCNDCNIYFGKNYLKMHIMKMHPSCNICETKFKDRKDLKNHVNEAHSHSSTDIVKDVLDNNEKDVIQNPIQNED